MRSYYINTIYIIVITLCLFQCLQVNGAIWEKRFSFGGGLGFRPIKPLTPNKVNEVVVPYTSCGSAGDHFNISTVTGNVWPPVAGDPLVLNITGDVDEKVTDGTYTLQVAYYGITIINENGDLSKFLTLPAGPGETLISYTEDLPSSAPDGPYVVTVSANDQNKAELLCIVVKFSIGAEEVSEIDDEKLESLKRWVHNRKIQSQ